MHQPAKEFVRGVAPFEQIPFDRVVCCVFELDSPRNATADRSGDDPESHMQFQHAFIILQTNQVLYALAKKRQGFEFVEDVERDECIHQIRVQAAM